MKTNDKQIKLGKAFSAHSTSDEYGRYGDTLGWFSTKAGAERAAKGKGWYGGDGGIEEHPTITTADGVYVLKQSKPIELDSTHEKQHALIRSAMSKLTPEERKALGMEPITTPRP